MKALLVTPITVEIYDQQMVFPADTPILVDVEKQVALIGNFHLHIDSHEYILLH